MKPRKRDDNEDIVLPVIGKTKREQSSPNSEDDNSDVILSQNHRSNKRDDTRKTASPLADPVVDKIKQKKRNQSPPNSRNENSDVILPPPIDRLAFSLHHQNQQDDNREIPLDADSEVQNPTCFPNQNGKQIDYVLFYKYNLNTPPAEFNRHELVRKTFLDRVIGEGIELEYLRYRKDSSINVFVLLHCPVERLLSEAERLKLQMNLKKVRFFCCLIENFYSLLT
jgi:hypothetical protein